MAERFQKLFSLPPLLYSEGAPVLLAAGALQKDSQTGKVIGQLKFRSISPKQIRGLKAELQPLDMGGRPLGEPLSHSYLDLQAPRDAEFGQQEPIFLSNAEARGMRARVTEVFFADGSSWTAPEGAVWEPLPAQQPLERGLGDGELAKQYRICYGEQAVQLPLRHGELWLCACGAVNRADEPRCHRCSLAIDELLGCDLQALTREKDERLAREQAEREAAEKKAAEERAAAEKKAAEEKAAEEARAKKTKKILAIALPALAVVLAAVLLITQVLIPGSKYKAAVALLENGQYDEAIAAFQKLSGYKDSYQKVTEAKEAAAFEDGVSAFDAGDWEAALDAFVMAGDRPGKNEYQAKIADILLAGKSFEHMGGARDLDDFWAQDEISFEFQAGGRFTLKEITHYLEKDKSPDFDTMDFYEGTYTVYSYQYGILRINLFNTSDVSYMYYGTSKEYEKKNAYAWDKLSIAITLDNEGQIVSVTGQYTWE